MSDKGTSNYSGFAAGMTVFAAIAMMTIGAFQAIVALTALLNDEFLVVTKKWTFSFDLTTWGWIHLLLSILLVLAGAALFSGQVWARAVGVILAVFSALVNFAWLPYYPIWSVIIITLDVFVIWALTVHGRDITA